MNATDPVPVPVPVHFSPFHIPAFKFVTAVVLDTENGAVPVATELVRTPLIDKLLTEKVELNITFELNVAVELNLELPLTDNASPPPELEAATPQPDADEDDPNTPVPLALSPITPNPFA